MTTYTLEIREKLERYLATHTLPKGIGSKEGACSIAAINLAISGKFTDDIPDCMSVVLGIATITLQDAMPDDMRNSARYKAWLPTAVGTGRNQERERLGVLMDWMWGTALPQLQPIADEKGFGGEWRVMCKERTEKAARAAARAATEAATEAARAATEATDAAHAATRAAARAATEAARFAADAANEATEAARAASRFVARAASRFVARAAYAAAYATYAIRAAAEVARVSSDADFWKSADPIGILERMTKLEYKT